jgi:2-keto-4-pentenoate hydratase/2-oxohepta-3-ene-1,7-dioic acid hydratase in catechol pathway
VWGVNFGGEQFRIFQKREFGYLADMKLIRFGEQGREWPGVLLPDGRRVDASGEFADYDEDFFAMGGLGSLARWVADGCVGGGEVDPLMRLGPPIARPSKILCIGKNYLEHAKELGEGVPSEPTIFMKASTAWSGPYDDVVIPRGAMKLDYEVELAVVIGSRASDVDELESLAHVAGYSTFCDYSERAFQKEMGGQWTKGKSADTFAPMGPWLVTADEVSDVQHLRLWCQVNGELRQNGWTGDMMCSVRQLVSYVSRFMTLLPGDVLATGTPGGVAMGMTPPRYLQAGDFVECGVEGLGEMGQRVVARR